MHDLTAQVTSSLLPFPGVTVDALGEDEITLDSVLHGKFTVGRSGLAWLACGPHLEVVHAVTGERLSAYCFSGGGEHPPSVLAARDFSWLKRSGLLVGIEETEGSVLCLYDLGLSRVVKAVVIPGRITAIEPLVSYGGASTSTQHLHQSLRWFFGIAAVVTDLGHVLLVDLCLDDLSCSQSELEASDLQVVTKSPAEIPRLREVSTRQGRHLCLQLNGPSGVGATALQYISRTNQLAVGFSDGYLQLWNMKALKKEYHSQLEGGRVPVHAFTFQEPENDPRNCCYLWAVQSSQELEGDMVSLHLLQLAFSERKCLASGKILYEGLEYCEERYSQELSGTAFPLRAQATNTRLLSCHTIEKFRPHPDRDDSMNEVASPDTSVSIFSWQVKAYGQGTPSTYIGVFDINRWYHAQMPDSLRMGESLQNCPYLAVWSLDPVVQMVSAHVLLDVVVHDRSLSRGLPFTCPPPEQYFNPTTYNFDSTCLLNSGIVHLTCSGYQKECKAKEKYDAAIEWALELITDYRIRIACGSFSGSFIEYFGHAMSYPVRRKYPQAASERLTIANDTMMETPCDDHMDDSFSEQQEEVNRSSKRLLPDRTHAAHNRANEKLVHFIVKQRMVEGHLLAVISGQQQSRWLRSFLSANRRRVVNIYLEDDQQLDQVYLYLNELYATAVATAPCLAEVKSMERVPFVLDVLLPEAIIYAIAGVDNVSVKKAEEKYLKGRCISNRERQEFDLMIERQMRKKSQPQNTALALF